MTQRQAPTQCVTSYGTDPSEQIVRFKQNQTFNYSDYNNAYEQTTIQIYYVLTDSLLYMIQRNKQDREISTPLLGQIC